MTFRLRAAGRCLTIENCPRSLIGDGVHVTAVGYVPHKAAFEIVKGERQVVALSEAQVKQHLDLADLLDGLQAGFLKLELGELQSPPRPQVTIAGKGFSLA